MVVEDFSAQFNHIPTIIFIVQPVKIQIMATITLNFTNKNGKFSLCAYTKGKNLRHYKTVDGLIAPNFKKWDSKSQKFTSHSESDKHNNLVLKSWLERYYYDLLRQRDFESG